MVSGKTMLDHIINAIDASNIKRKIIVCNNENKKDISDQLYDRENLEFLIQDKQIGTSNAIQEAIKKTQLKNISSVYVFLGDAPLISNSNITQLSEGLDDYDIAIASFIADNPHGYGRIILNNNKDVIKIVEELDASKEEKEINICFSGLIAFNNPKLLKLFDEITNKNNAGEFYLTDIIKIAKSKKFTVRNIILPYNDLRGVNTNVDLMTVEIIMQKNIKNKLIEEGVRILLPDTTYVSSDVTIGKNVTIEPNVYIGEKVKIKDNVTIKSFSYIEDAELSSNVSIGPFARIRGNTKIKEDSKIGNFVEIKNSNIAENVKINHLSYIGDSKVGKRTNIGAGTITCNFDGEQKYHTTIGEGVFIGSNSSIIAPVTIDDNSYIASGSVINNDVPKGSLAIARNRQENKTNWTKKSKK
tara:strand:+ start:599 stop:1843 length:1245 start_codon:yes stop_codon:yes gene_type:complete